MTSGSKEKVPEKNDNLSAGAASYSNTGVSHTIHS